MFLYESPYPTGVSTLQIELTSPAKLNLFLLVTSQREDGYHNLQTLFQLLDYGDQMHFRLREDEQINLLTHFEGVLAEDNLIINAANLLQNRLKALGHSVCGADISIQKKLPMGAGLGGGSSNAATTLLALNHLWQTNIGLEELAKIGIKLGADVPIFVAGNSAYAQGVGEVLTPTEIPETWYFVLDPKVNISTAKIFSNPQLTRNSAPIKIPALAADCIRNDCQIVVEKLYPQVAKARIWLEQFGQAQLTGTGASLFTKFATYEDALEVFKKLPSDWDGFIAKGVNKSPTHQQMYS